MNSIARVALASASLALPLAAQTSFPQDVIAVTFGGDAVTLDSRTGVGQVIGPTGRTGHNSMARAGRQLYTVEQVGTGQTAQRFLNTVDDVTGVASRSVSISRDLRGLAFGGQFQLMAIADDGANDEFVRVDVFNGTITVVGSTGFGSLQGLTLHDGTFYAWDLNAGLVRIDLATGAGTDVNPSVGTNGAAIQFLNTMSDGRVIGGQSAIYEIDVATGVPALRGSGAYNDLRGAEERFGVIYTFGEGCANVSLDLSGEPRGGSTITTASSGNRRLAAGFLLLGLSDRNYLGVPLPLRLDAFLGTLDCFLYTGLDFTIAASVNAFGVMTVPVTIPLGLTGTIFHVQHLSLSNAPGGLAFSNGGTVRVRL
jgi:hypothetical protein